MDVKLLALDLDGTIVKDLATISNRVEAAIRAAIRRGVRVTLATGREFTATARFARRLKTNAPVICYQGGLVRDHRNGKTLFAQTIPADVSRQVIKFARARKLPMLMYTPQTPFAELPTPLMRRTFEQAGSPFELVNNLLAVLDDDSLPLKFLFIQPPTHGGRVRAMLGEAFGDALTITQSLATLVEATPPGVSKGEALRRLAQQLNISLAQTMAIGDQDNDAAMIEVAGLGVAMQSGSARARAAAAVIAPSLADDGAAWAIERYILNRHADSDN
ncbi:MAG: Cof-type HAD-IIB family hydrolase [Anaerolineae bacterium]